MAKIDFKKELKEFYSASKSKVAIVEVPAMKYIMVDGVGDPNTSADFQAAIEALYGTAYTLKFAMKESQPEGYFEFVVPPLEGLWWMDPGPFDPEAKDKWQWTVMIMQPDFVTSDMIEGAIETLRKKKPSDMLDKLRYETLEEGVCGQMLHIGPYSQQGSTIEKIQDHIEAEGYSFSGKHHEVYLSDPRRTAPEKLKTIIRHPVAKD